MRAGKLDQTIELRRPTIVDDGMGGQVQGPTATYATAPAQVVQASTEEFMRSWGASSETIIVFRIRHIDGVLLSDEVKRNGKAFDIKEIKPIGRRRGLELRCVARG